jgi:hypothetical protein
MHKLGWLIRCGGGGGQQFWEKSNLGIEKEIEKKEKQSGAELRRAQFKLGLAKPAIVGKPSSSNASLSPSQICWHAFLLAMLAMLAGFLVSLASLFSSQLF